MKEAFVVHMEGQQDTILLSANGRILTEPMDMPQWAASGVTLALLADRAKFYQTRLGPELAAPILGSSIVNYLDLGWVAVDEAGDEVTIDADDEFRQNMLATSLGVDRETGDIENAITERYIDRDGQVYTAEEIVTKHDADAAMARKAG